MSQVIATPQQLTEVRDRVRAEQAAQKAAGHKQVRICMGAGCIASGAEQVKQSIEAELARNGIKEGVSVIGTGCLGPCSAGPTLMIDDVFYENVKPQDGSSLVNEHVLRGQIVSRLTHRRADGRKVANAAEMDFFKRQAKIVLRNCGVIDPQRIEDYIGRDGYQALATVLAKNAPSEVIETMRVSGLRGRGGAASPPGGSGNSRASRRAKQNIAVCNADEGDPGAFMDRSVLEGDPHSVIEGMMIAAHTIGASRGYIYVRAEYPLAVARLKIAIAQAQERGILGKNIFGCGFDFDLEIRMGSGAFVCGEETALMTSIEGNRGEPRPRPPFPAQQGLWGKPTLLNNVETYANVPAIVLKGGGVVCCLRHGKEPRNQSLRPGRRDQELRPGGSARGHAAGRPDLRRGRRHFLRQGVQGRANGRAVRRLHPQAAPQRAAGLRVALGTGRDHGLRRPDRDGRG